MKPKRGKIVDFTERNGEQHPAIIRRVNKHNETVDLTVFRHSTETYHVDIPYSVSFKPLHWSWPIDDILLGEKSVQ